MTTFLNDVIADLKKKDLDFSKLSFILPSKRAGVFLRYFLSQQLKKSIFAPKILSIEEFIESLSDLNYATSTELLFFFYEVYEKNTPKDLVEPFDTFSKWAQILIQDFNEMDRYLVDSNHVFDYLNAIKKIEHHHWSLEDNQTDYIKRYLSFWDRLKSYYAELQKVLIKNKKGYQGLVYREALENIEQYISLKSEEQLVFVGFNALNNAEEIIVQELLQQNMASIYWDIDQKFVGDPIHDAGLFVRSHRSNWKYFNNAPFNWLTNHYSQVKDIKCVGASKNIGQVKYIGELLLELQEKNPTLENTAVILGDESLLLPLLNSLPKSIGAVNITMGLPLSKIPMASFFESLFKLHKAKPNSKSLYHKDIVSILSNQFVKPLFNEGNNNVSDHIINTIRQNNILYASLERLKTIAGNKADIVTLLFESWENKPGYALEQCSKLIFLIKASFDNDKHQHKLALEYLYRFNVIFNELSKLTERFGYINSITTLHGLYRELIKSETLDFKGEPLKGLQIMGMLESRVLDFETIIISSVNEGILPSGKQNSSFIPFDVKIENKMPTYKEKDAVYTYHFYRLLQRAKTIHLIYNTEPDVLNGGEKSRFITQLDIDSTHNIDHYLLSPKIAHQDNNLLEVIKTKDIMTKLYQLAGKGLSPSSLTNYIRNPIAFYNEKILGIRAYEEVEENVAYNTLGTIIHNSLEDLYKPMEGLKLSVEAIKLMLSKAEKIVLQHFEAEYKEGDITKGKNLIIFEIAKHYISQFLKFELLALQKGHQIEILAIETNNAVSVSFDGIDVPVLLKGKVDRMDRFDGVTRIIDYKTGKVEQKHVQVSNWEELNTDYEKYSKSFQLLMYTYMMYKEGKVNLPVEAGIFSFKNLNAGIIKFATKQNTKVYKITEDTLKSFEAELKNLILEIYNPNLPFVEKEQKYES
ncbi:PD-(D/E)XK nuclease family protein [Psychroserpens sp. XS_ASV72]|uniref:PD-(D/E)XK nuclease family protein n=1 Tax=Psychroserpens sp. XS_ASV72 TaxID=3241293 RepID=UPI003515F03B